MSQDELNRKRGRFVPWIIGLFYLTFTTALIGFVFIAYAHPPADSTEEAYDKGLAYNAILAKADAQSELGWRSSADYTRGRLTFILQDHNGQPIKAARGQAWFVRSGNPADDRSFVLHDDGDGNYFAKAPLPATGMWTVHVTVEKAGRQYQSVSTIEVD